MVASETVQLISYLLPVLTAFLCLLLSLGYCFLEEERQRDNKPVYTMIVYYSMNVCRWLVVSSPAVFASIYPLFYISLVFSQVSGYYLVFLLTGTGIKERFSIFHYIFPIVITLVVVVILLWMEYRTQYSNKKPEYFQYLFVPRFIPAIFSIVFTSLYTGMGIRRLNRFRRKTDKHSVDYGRSTVVSLYLIFHLFYIVLSLVSFFLMTRFSGSYILADYIIPFLWRALPIGLYPVLCYNLLRGNYIIVSSPVGESKGKEVLRLNRTAFETYMHKYKPYLDPELKITDLLLPFCTNRQYMSEFVNKEYGMNFSRYINTLRMQEVERMRSLSKYDGLSEIELIIEAGFRSYRSYRYFLGSTRGKV
ncbi:MAG: hypothetical protein LBV71_03580 [Prevotella sp.]|jgi:heme/copper-type cytochrome/quinol oxidase subunit 4/AraC-like DNA-binding protein|nr:hypothetical protein [Prevotella sp.]